MREFIEVAARELSMDMEWQGDGIDEIGIDRSTGRQIVAVDPRYFRLTEVEILLGDPATAKRLLGWEAKTAFLKLVKEMIAGDHATAKRDALVRQAGYQTFNYHE